MANTNFLQFDPNKTNMLSDSSYSSDTQRVSGVSSGVARSNLYNKHAFQTSTMCKAIADFLVDNNVNAMDNNLTALKNSIASVFATTGMDSQNVKITGTQTVSGSKTFTSACYFTGGLNRKATWEVGVPPSGSTYIGVNLEDSTGTIYGSLRKQYNANGSLYTQISATKQDGSTSENISIGYDGNGNAVATTTVYPNATTATNSTQIATTGWVNTVGNNVVHLSGTETITGEKTFTGTFKTRRASTGYYSMYNYNDAITIGTAPSANTAVQFNMEDSVGGQNHRVGGWSIRYNADGSTQTGLTAYKPDGTVQTNSGLGIIYPASGDPYGYAPTPSSATDNSTKIATTEWVAGHRCTTQPTTTSTASANAPDVVTSNYYNSDNGYWAIKFSSGLIIQGGKSYSTLSDNTGRTITFPKAFATTNYSISAIPIMGSSHSGYRCVAVNVPETYKKTSSMSVFNDGEDIAGFEWLAIGY